MNNHAKKLISKEELGKIIGENVRKIRVEKGISQAELARLCEKDRQHIELIENGKVSPNIYTLYTVSMALQIGLSDLFDCVNASSKTLS